MSSALRDELLGKVYLLSETVWRTAAIKEPAVSEWLSNFTGTCEAADDEKLHALFLLSNFMFFDLDEVREMLRSVYRELFRYPLIQEIRQVLGVQCTWAQVQPEFEDHLAGTRFIGMGNPSESGSLLLYFFRQVNEIPVELFIHSHQIFRRYGGQASSLRDATARHYVFLDDLSGSGEQAVEYSQDLVLSIKEKAPDARTSYFVLVATAKAIERIRAETAFDDVGAIFELDETFECFHSDSRFFANPPKGISQAVAKNVAAHYGTSLFPPAPLGYEDCQLLLGFWHNTPDNTLPIVWAEGNSWYPIFKRYPKVKL